MREFKKLPLELFIGYDIEQNSRVIELDASEMVEKYPSGILQLVCKRPGEETTYIAPSFEQDGGTLRWTLTSYDVEKAGQGLAIVALVDTSEESVKVLASHKIRTGIEEGLHFRDAETVDPEDSLIARVLAAVSQAQAYAQDAKEEADRAEAVLDDVDDAKDQAISAIETKGAETLESIPADYTTLSGDVSDLKSALTSMADVYYTSENLFNPATFEVGKALDSNGGIATNSNFCLSEYVPVKSGWILNGYIAQNTINGLGGWFDENKVYKGKIEELSGYTLTNRNKRYFTLVCNFDGYIRVNVYVNAPYQQAMLKLNTEIDTSLSEPLCKNYHAYEPAYEKTSELKVQTSYGKFVHENNGLFNPTKSVNGYLASDGAQVWSNDRYKTSDFIPLDGNTDYLIQGITTKFCLYDSSKTNITSSFDSNDATNKSFNSGSASFARFTYYATEESRMYARIASEQFFDTEKGGAYFTNDNPLLGKTLYTIGDSIMEGNGNRNFGIGDIIASRNSMYLNDLSKGGATIGWRESIGNAVGNIQYQATLASAETAPDYILIDGQTNDIDNASTIPVGEVGASFDSTNFVKTSFAGGLETIFSTLKTAFPSAKIVYVRVHHIGSRGLDSQNVRCETAENACFKWGIPIADIYGKGTLNTFLTQYEQYTNNADKTHPNRLGYDLFYIPLIESVMKAV